jgi:hypothetical protein
LEHQHQEDAYRLLETWFSTPRTLPYIADVEGCGDFAVYLDASYNANMGRWLHIPMQTEVLRFTFRSCMNPKVS